ncbi:MAG: phosphatidylcholine/phosphatidylserine synthase [Vicinamibacterales bacterium]
MQILPWIAHAYTASGAVIALLATGVTFAHNFRAAFIYLGIATLVDATDGVLARALKVKERLPHYDGARLDDIVDYLTYVFVPVLIVWQAELVPVPFPVGAAILLSSAYGFGQANAKIKSSDHFFTGFPSYWNIVVAYLYLWQLEPAINAAILLALAVLVFVPIRYVYPSRTMALKGPTLVLGTAWGAVFAWMVWRLPATGGPWIALSMVYPVYYFALSLWLHFRR